MKLIHFLAPVLALAGSAYWLHARQGTIEELTEKTKIIRDRVTLVNQAESENANPVFGNPDAEKPDEFTLPDGSLDWKKIAGMMAESRGSNGMPTNIKSMLKLQQKLMEMDEDVLADGLEKIASLDLDPEVVAMLRQGLLSQLSQKNPLAALEALGDPVTSRNDSSGLYWMQSNLLAQLAKDDPAAAQAWMDKMIADGKLQSTTLDQHNDIRLQFEAALINQLVRTDYESAKARLENFSDKDKAHLLSNRHVITSGIESQNLLKLARESLPPEEASNVIISSFGNQFHDKLSSISEALSEVELSETERVGVVTNLVGNYARNNDSENKYQEIYEWSQSEVPGQEVSLVTQALVSGGNHWQSPQKGFEQALDLAKTLEQPDILTGFVAKVSQNGNESTVERQLEQFKDPTLAEQYQEVVKNLPETNQPTSEVIERGTVIESIEVE